MKLKSKLGTLGGHTGRAVLLVVVGALAGAVATAIAAVPGGDGVIHACYEVAQDGTTPLAGAPNLRIIDPAAGQTCDVPGGPGPVEHALSWNATGPPGPEGAAGPSGAQGTAGPQGASGPAGSTVTLDGQAFTLGDGKTLTPPASPIPPLQVPAGGPPVATMTLGSGGTDTSSKVLGWQLVGTHGIQIVIRADKSSATLFKACVTGRHIRSGTLTMRAGSPNEIQTIKLINAKVDSYSTDKGKGTGKGKASTAPTETVSLNYTSIKYDLN
jgi:type VI protein secretion system component Hcp